MLRGFNRAAQQANLHQECALCYDDLTNAAVARICDKRNRPVCMHEYHTQCLQRLMLPSHCRICSKEFHKIAPVFKITQGVPTNPSTHPGYPTPVPVANNIDPHQGSEWFDCLDIDRNGKLSYEEIIEGLKSQVKLDWHRIEGEVDRLWGRWDTNGDMMISKEEFIRPRDGVLAYLIANYSTRPRPPPPDIRQNKAAWFQYWDEDNSRALSKEEIARALIKTFRMFHVDQDSVVNVLDMIWPIFDGDNSGVIEMKEFIAPDNLADTIIAQLQDMARR